MLIALDIGNSFINIGFFTEKGLFVRKIETYPIKPYERYASLLMDFLAEISIEKNTHEVIISSVVTGHTEVLAEACRDLMPEDFLIVGPEVKTGLVFDISTRRSSDLEFAPDGPEAGRWAAKMARMLDFGTAT